MGKTIKDQIAEVVHLCGCGVANLNPEDPDYTEKIEAYEEEVVNAILALMESLQNE